MKNKPAFIGISIESGQTQLGLKMSPLFARSLLQKKWDFEYFGEISDQNSHHHYFCTEDLDLHSSQPYQAAYRLILQAYQSHEFVLNWGGDHSVGMATAGAFIKNFSNGWIIWIDAHADVNTSYVSPSGNLHGMPVSLLLGLEDTHFFPEIHGCLNPKKLIYLGLRSVENFEKQLIQDLGICHYDMTDIGKHGLTIILEEIKTLVKNSPLHISFDIDSVDPTLAPATGIQEPGGLTLEHLTQVSSQLSLLNYKSLDVVEINPLLGNLSDVERTFQVAVQFLEPFIQNFQLNSRTASMKNQNLRNWLSEIHP